MRAEILTIGDELCRGEIIDSNSSHLAALLWDLSITTRWMTSCNDDEADIASALALAVRRADLVVCSGGLGPTEDDLTVDVVAKAAGVQPVIDEPARQRLDALFARRAVAAGVRAEGPEAAALAAIQLRQVRVPSGARVHPNLAGLAPGFEIPVEGVPVICLPGFPREIASILESGLARRFGELREAGGRGDGQPQAGLGGAKGFAPADGEPQASLGGAKGFAPADGEPQASLGGVKRFAPIEQIARRIYRVFGRGESQISQACRGLIDGIDGVSIHYQVKFPETMVKLVVRRTDAAEAAQVLAALDAGIRERLAGFLYGEGDETLVDRTMRRLLETGRTVATAESCTGGMIGELLTRRPGSSRAYLGGAITYANSEKVRQLGVSEATLAAHGAVSEETVREMALGARARFGVDFAVAVSGVAGPDGGTPDKPVGMVWLALASEAGLKTHRLGWPGTRDQIRMLSSWWALKLIDEANA